MYTPPSRNPRTLPYCVFAIADRGVEQLPGSWCAPVLVLSEAKLGTASAAPIPAVAESISASRRFRMTLFPELCFVIAISLHLPAALYVIGVRKSYPTSSAGCAFTVGKRFPHGKLIALRTPCQAHNFHQFHSNNRPALPSPKSALPSCRGLSAHHFLVISVMCMKKSVCIALGALLLSPLSIVASAQTASNQKQIQALEQQVQKYLQQQKPQLAIPLLRDIVLLDPQNLNANANLGVLLYFQNNYAEAIPPMHTALQLKPDLWRIQALAGIAEKRTGDPLAAQNDLERAFPNLQDLNIRKQAGLELVELDSSFGQLAKAASITEQMEELSPQDPQILFVAWEISSQMTDQSLLNLLLVAPNSAEMHMAMAGQLGRQGDHANAIAQYKDAIRLNPNLPGVHFELAEQLRASPDPALNAQAEAEYQAAVQQNQYDVQAWCRLGDSVAAKGDFKTAETDYKKALALQPKNSDAQTALAIAFMSTNRMSEAMPLLEAAVKDDPTNIVAHYRLSVLYRRAGRITDAQQQMNEFNHYKELKSKLGRAFQQVQNQPGTP